MAKIQFSRLSLTLAAATIAMPAGALAQATPAPAEAPEIAADPAVQQEVTVYLHGSVKDRNGAKPALNPRDSKLPALPVVYDDEPTAPARSAPAA